MVKAEKNYSNYVKKKEINMSSSLYIIQNIITRKQPSFNSHSPLWDAIINNTHQDPIYILNDDDIEYLIKLCKSSTEYTSEEIRNKELKELNKLMKLAQKNMQVELA